MLAFLLHNKQSIKNSSQCVFKNDKERRASSLQVNMRPNPGRGRRNSSRLPDRAQRDRTVNMPKSLALDLVYSMAIFVTLIILWFAPAKAAQILDAGCLAEPAARLCDSPPVPATPGRSLSASGPKKRWRGAGLPARFTVSCQAAARRGGRAKPAARIRPWGHGRPPPSTPSYSNGV